MDSEKLQSLFAQTLAGDYEGHEAWDAVTALRQNGSRAVFEHAAEWIRAADPLKRARAADILCQLRRAGPLVMPAEPEWMFRDESYELIAGMLPSEQNPMVLVSAISALGHLGRPAAIPLIMQYRDHLEEPVRFAVACSLGSFPNDSQSIAGLLELTIDASSDVRDWAIFGLGVLGDTDSPEIRNALLRCLNDSDQDVREEAAVGLGKRHDARVVPALLAMLDQNGDYRPFEAAAALLGLDSIPEDWSHADCKAALRAKFEN